MASLIHRKEKIVFTAIEVINKLGVQALSTKAIARAEDIAESTIFKHYGSKIEILSAVLDFYSQYDEDISQSIKAKDLHSLKALEFYLESYLKYYENYPAITAITQGLDEMRYIEELAGKVITITNNRSDSLIRILEEAQNDGSISDRFSAISYTDAIMGSINGIIRRWRMEEMSFDLVKRCYDAVSLIVGYKFVLKGVDIDGGEF